MKDISLQKAYNLFIFDRETYVGDKTILNYKNTLKYLFIFLEEHFGLPADKIMLDDITTNDLKAYIHMLRNRDKLSTHPYKPTVTNPVTNTTIHTYSVDFRSFFNFCYQEELMEKDIMKSFKMIKGESKLIVILYDDEVAAIDKLFNLKTVSGLRNYCIVHLMVDAGLRSGDVTNLSLRSLDFTHRQIVIYDGKGHKDRIIPMAATLRKHLYIYQERYRPHCDSDNFFVSVNGKNTELTENTIKALFARIRAKTGIERLKPHLLRHTFATSFIRYGGDMESLRLFLGHTSYSVTQKYLHLANVYKRTDAKIYKIDAIFFKRVF